MTCGLFSVLRRYFELGGFRIVYLSCFGMLILNTIFNLNRNVTYGRNKFKYSSLK